MKWKRQEKEQIKQDKITRMSFLLEEFFHKHRHRHTHKKNLSLKVQTRVDMGIKKTLEAKKRKKNTKKEALLEKILERNTQ